MSQIFDTSEQNQALAEEVTTLKIMMTFILRSMSQVDGGNAILNMEQYLSTMENSTAKETFSKTLQQIKAGYIM